MFIISRASAPLLSPAVWHKEGICPAAEAAYKQILSLPMFPVMTDEDIDAVISAVKQAVS